MFGGFFSKERRQQRRDERIESYKARTKEYKARAGMERAKNTAKKHKTALNVNFKTSGKSMFARPSVSGGGKSHQWGIGSDKPAFSGTMGGTMFNNPPQQAKTPPKKKKKSSYVVVKGKAYKIA